jgi:hypothetical protein
LLISQQSCHPERRRSRSRRTRSLPALPLLLAPFILNAPIHAQAAFASDSPLAPSSSITHPAPAPTSPATHTFYDPTYHLSFDYPANWTFSHADGEISTFHLDARSALPKTGLRAVVAEPENPFPASTFSGAYVYFSITPHSSASACARQARTTSIVKNGPQVKPGDKVQIAGIPFTHGHDEQRDICITQRDEIYTTSRHGLCYRFDLSINNFCGGEVSGVKDITPQELDQVRARLESILSTIRFDPK